MINFSPPFIYISNATPDYSILQNGVTFKTDLRQSAGTQGTEDLEFSLDGSGGNATIKQLYAMFDGIIYYDKQNKRIQFEFDPESQKNSVKNQLMQLNNSVKQVKNIYYGNVDDTTIQQVWTNLISDAYQNYQTNKNNAGFVIPRVLIVQAPNLVVAKGGKLKKSKYGHSKLVKILDNNPGNTNNIIQQTVNSLITNGHFLPVSSGDYVADAALVAGTTYEFHLSLSDESDNALNPIYLLYLIFRQKANFNFNSSMGLDDLLKPNSVQDPNLNSKVHPLLLQLAGKVWGPFVSTVDGNGYNMIDQFPNLFLPSSTGQPAGINTIDRPASLKTFYQFTDNGITSNYSWRISDNLYLQYNPIGSLDPKDLNVTYFTFGKSTWNKVLSVWQNYSVSINNIANVFQIPCEIIIAFVVHESAGSERVCALEPWIPDNAPQNIPNPPPSGPGWNYFLLTHEWDNTKNKWIPSRLPVVVPQPSDFGNDIDNSVSGYTWNDLKNDLNNFAKLQKKVSPGFMQTLISTTMTTITNLTNIQQNGLTGIGINLPNPNNASDIFDWLLTAQNSIAIGAAYLSSQNTSIGLDLDPILLAGSYNRGKVISYSDPTCSGGASTPNNFNLCLWPGYLEGQSLSLTKCVNAAIRLLERYDFLASKNLTNATLRFK